MSSNMSVLVIPLQGKLLLTNWNKMFLQTMPINIQTILAKFYRSLEGLVVSGLMTTLALYTTVTVFM